MHQLTAANHGKLPVSMDVKLDLDFLGIVVPKVGVLITQEPNELFEECHKTKLPGAIHWNLIKLAYQVFVQKYGSVSLENFDCPTGISPLLFSHFVYFITAKQVESIWTVLPSTPLGSSSYLKKVPNNLQSVKMGYWVRF